MPLTSFFHYTSYEGLQAIQDSGYIRLSPNKHCHFGKGTYGTSLPPWAGKSHIAYNNWLHHGRNYIRSGKCDWAIELKIPRSQVRKAKCQRDILVFKGPLYLEDFRWRLHEVDDDSDDSEDDVAPPVDHYDSDEYYDYY